MCSVDRAHIGTVERIAAIRAFQRELGVSGITCRCR
jgi:hypothetical protein